MARIINTATDIDKLIGISSYHAYNALDSCVTREVFDKIAAKLDNQHTNSTYRDARALQAPVLSMTQTGCLVDQKTRGELLAKYQADGDFLTKQLKQLISGYIDASIEFGFLPETERAKFADFNWRSGDQLKHFFYDIMNMPAVLNDKGNPSVDRDALERLVRYPVATPYCKILMQLRDIGKAITDLTKDLDADGRFRASFNIAGTTTGRFSSYKSAFDTGSNAQNQDPLLRKMFCSDKGKKLAYVDLEQAEARLVGAILFNLFGDSKYLDACEGGDTHTNVAKMVWPDIIKSKADAEQPFYRNFSYRFICKRLGFGSNYGGLAQTLSAETKIPRDVVERFQELYFTTFPMLHEWHKWVACQIEDPGYIVSLMGRKRWFFGRADDDSTIREAIAYDPQESVAKILNIGLFNLWYKSYRGAGKLPLDFFFQVHDAVLLQYPEEQEAELLPQICSLIQTPITLRSARQFTIPAEAKIGWNWGDYDGHDNTDGLVKWDRTCADGRTRSRPPSLSILDQQLR